MPFLSIALFCATAFADPPKFRNSDAITPERLRAHLSFVASDELEGRSTPSRGLDIATLYVASQMQLWGAQPGGDNGTFFQNIKLVDRQIDPVKSHIDFDGGSYRYGDGFIASSKEGKMQGKLVYVGHGYIVKTKGIDPTQGIDLKGKIMLVAAGLPKGVTYDDFRQETKENKFPIAVAIAHGAVGILTIPDASKSYSPYTQLVTGISKRTYVPGPWPTNVTAGPSLAKAIFQGEKISLADAAKGVDAPEVAIELMKPLTADIEAIQSERPIAARNVVAIVPGSDEKLKHEYVAFGAHIDHLGMYTDKAPGDHIYNGADDDGSGTVSVLEIAHALLTGKRPKRSSIFVWHCGEEMGLWGSTYFTDNPTVPLLDVVAQVNLDMVGRSKKPGDAKVGNQDLTGPKEIYVIGPTIISDDLRRTAVSVNDKFLKLEYNFKYDDPKNPNTYLPASDQFNYALNGIPVLFYFNGTHEDYHGVTDEVSRIDFEKMTAVARTAYATGWTLANTPHRPKVTRPYRGWMTD